MVTERATRANSREAILDAAETVFAERGFDGTTVSDICEAANVSRGLPNYLFGSKEQLYREIVERSAVHLRAAVTEPLLARPAKSLRDAVVRFIDTYVDYLARNPAIVRLLQWELLSDPSSPRPFAPASRLFGEIHEIFVGVATRERSEVDVRTLLASVVSLCFFPFVMGTRVKVQMLYDGSYASAGALKRHVTGLITASLRGKRHA
jgi:TetR/AcrR family transcriptional regulator